MFSDPVIAALLGALGATLVALINGVLSSRQKVRDELRDIRLEKYPDAWKLTSSVPRWPRADLTYADLRLLHRELKNWYFDVGGLYMSENARARYGDVQGLLEAYLEGRQESDSDAVPGSAGASAQGGSETVYEAIMETCSAFRTSLTEDLATRRSASFLWAIALAGIHITQHAQAKARINRAKVHR